MLEVHHPSAWHFGHFHFNREFLIGETNFRCLAEMEPTRLSARRAWRTGVLYRVCSHTIPIDKPKENKKLQEL